MDIRKSFRQIKDRIDLGFFVVLAICLLALWPFISRVSLPLETDAELHIFRLAELSRLIRGGEIFPRWAPNFYYGYGYPIFNYYAPLTYYIGLPIDFLPVLGPVAAVKGVFILGILCAGIGMYGFVRDNWGRGAGLIATTAYVYAPYLLFVDPHARGDLAESFSFGIFPLALWAIDKLRRRPTAWNWLAATTLTAGFIMTHNLMAMIFFGLLLGWAFWQTLFKQVAHIELDVSKSFQILFNHRLFISLILAVGIAAFFWLTVALEQNAVNLSSLIGEGGNFDFRNHFLSIGELLSPSKLIDWGATESAFRLNLGVGQWVLAIIGIFVLIKGTVPNRIQGIFFGVTLVLLIILMLPISTPLWQSIPLLPFLQFPWRLLGVTAVAIAVLAGAGTAGLMKAIPSPFNLWVPAFLAFFILAFSLPSIQVAPWDPDFGPTTAKRSLEIELSGRWLGTTSTADFVPATVDLLPKPASNVLDDIYAGRPIDRVNRSTLPENAKVESTTLKPLHYRYLVSGDKDFLLRLLLFDFPGWKVIVDGKPHVYEVGRPEGFIVIPMTAGEHTVDVYFGTTFPRVFAGLISLLSLIFTLIYAWKLSSLKKMLAEQEGKPDKIHDEGKRVIWSVGAVAIIFLILQAFIFEPSGLIRYESSGDIAIPASVKADTQFGDQIQLIGYDISSDSVSPGDELEITAFWKAKQPLDINYQVFVHLLDPAGIPVTQSDKLNPGDFPTKRWPNDKYVRDTHQLEIPSDLPLGEYQLSIGLWVADDGWRLPVLDENGRQSGDSFFFTPTITIE